MRSYYGRMDYVKPKRDILYMFINDEIRKQLNEQLKIFEDQIKDIFKEIKKEYLNKFKEMDKKLSDLKEEFKKIENKDDNLKIVPEKKPSKVKSK